MASVLDAGAREAVPGMAGFQGGRGILATLTLKSTGWPLSHTEQSAQLSPSHTQRERPRYPCYLSLTQNGINQAPSHTQSLSHRPRYPCSSHIQPYQRSSLTHGTVNKTLPLTHKKTVSTKLSHTRNGQPSSLFVSRTEQYQPSSLWSALSLTQCQQRCALEHYQASSFAQSNINQVLSLARSRFRRSVKELISPCRKVDIRLPRQRDSNSHGARPVYSSYLHD